MLQKVKDYLKITWDDEDQNLTEIIERAKAYLNNLVGIELDFDAEDDPRALLLDRCRYVYNNAGEYFAENFEGDILRLQLAAAVKDVEGDEHEG